MSTNEKISALVDRQTSKAERRALFERMRGDRGACEAWRRYHLIGCVLRGEISHCGEDLSARIGARLAEEPALRARKVFHWRAPGRRALAVSFAALLAGLALFALPPSPQDGAPVASLPDARAEREFHAMLVQHGEFASSPGLNGLVVYAKLVSDQPLRQSPRNP